LTVRVRGMRPGPRQIALARHVLAGDRLAARLRGARAVAVVIDVADDVAGARGLSVVAGPRGLDARVVRADGAVAAVLGRAETAPGPVAGVRHRAAEPVAA